MSDANNINKKKNFVPKTPPKPNYQIWIILSLLVLVFSIYYFNQSGGLEEITESKFEEIAKKGHVKEIIVIKNQEYVEVFLNDKGLASGEYNIPERPSFAVNKIPHFRFTIASVEYFLDKFNEMNEAFAPEDRIAYKVDTRSDMTSLIFNWGFLFLILVVFWILMRRMTGTAGPGGQIFNIGKSRAALFDAENKVKVTFADVAGLEEAKEEVKEIVDFLKDPTKYTVLGGKIPKGALLIGPPGTGKTLLDP